MGGSEKIKTFEGLGDLKNLMEIRELEAMGKQELQKRLKKLKTEYSKEDSLRDLARKVLEAENSQPAQGEVSDVEHSEPPVTQEFENAHTSAPVEGRFEIVHPPRPDESAVVVEPTLQEKVDAKWKEISDRLTERERVNEDIADLLARGKKEAVINDPQKFQHFGEFEGDIDWIAQKKRERLGRKSSDKPFPPPKPKEGKTVKKEAPVVENSKTEPIVLPKRETPLHREDLGGQKKEETTKNDELETLAQKIFKGAGELTKTEEKFIKDNPIIHQRLRELYENREPINPAPTPFVSESFSRPVAESESMVVYKGKEAKGSQESGINGLVQFNLERLGINPEDIKRDIPNFFTLSADQQNYILDRLGRKVHKDLNLESAYELKNKDVAVKAKNKGFFGGVKNIGIGLAQGLTRNTRQRAIRNGIEDKLKAGGLASYKGSLETLTNFVKTRDIDITVNEKGQKVLQFLKREGANDSHKTLIKRFNEIASTRAEMPDSWSAPEAKKSLREKAAEIEKEYKKAQQRLFQYELRNGSGEQNNGKVIDFLQINNAVEMNRLLTHNPEIMSFAGGVVRDYKLDNKFSHMALGASVRGLFQYGVAMGGGTTALATMSSGILGASLTGGVVGVLNRKKEMKMAAEQKRSGIDTKTKMQGVAGMIDAGDYVRRIDDLIQKIGSTPAGKKREQLLQSLQNRVTVAEERMSQKAVGWGKGDKEYLNKFDLFDRIGKAGNVLVQESGISKQVAQNVYGKFERMHFQDSAKASERSKELKKAFLKGATWGGVGAAVGLEANDWLTNDGELTKAGINELVQADNEMRDVVGLPPNELPFNDKETLRMNPTPVTAGQEIGPRGDELHPDKLAFDGSEMVSQANTPVAEVSFGSRGAIGTIKDLQRAVVDQYDGNVPNGLKDFVEAKPEKLAIDWKMYKPWQPDESIALPKGTSFVAMPDGRVLVKMPDGTMVTDFEANFFDSGARAQDLASVPAGPTVGTTQQIPRFAPPEGPGVFTDPDGQPVPTPEPGVSVYGPGGFEEYRDARLSQGWEHTPLEGGDAFTAAVDPEAARQYAPDFYPEDSAPAGPDVVEGYRNIDGLPVDSKELKGTIDFLYDSKGIIKSVDLPKLQVEDVSRFRANPESFIGGSHEASEQALLGKKLLTMRSEVETFLKYRRIMEIQSLNPDSDEYKFLNSESNRLWSAIQKKVEYQFNPEYKGFGASPIENTAPMVRVPEPQPVVSNEAVPNSGEPVPVVRSLDVDQSAAPESAQPEAPAIPEGQPVKIESTSEFVKTGRDSVRLESQTYLDAAGKYGAATVVDGNVVEFKDGYVGFYGESIDQGQAARECQLAANENASRLGAPVDSIAYQDQASGKYRILFVYKKR